MSSLTEAEFGDKGAACALAENSSAAPRTPLIMAVLNMPTFPGD
jgi:hypothetical protein